MLRSSFRLMLAAAVVFPAACSRTPRQGGSETRASQVLRVRLAGTKAPSYAAGDVKAAETWNAVRRLYEANGYEPVWLDDGRGRKEIGVLRDAIQRAAADGLDPAEYDLAPADVLQAARGRGLFKKGDAEPLLDADVRLTYTFLKFAEHLERGRVPPGQVDEHWFGAQRDEDLAKVLKASLDSGKLGEGLERLKSQHPQYAALKKVLARYREAAAHGGWGTLPAGRLRQGHPDAQVAALRAHLVATGDLDATLASPAAASAAPTFDAATRDALKRFERRHGLAADGRLDAEVLRALNVPVEERIRQIELNLERWRWLPETLGERYVLVNIPTYHLTAVDGGRVALQMRVVAGKEDSPTPIFSDEMT
ncbi:MAG TPA: peptidoglycan-binding protein, partial [Vicinamibacteria bacterium]|nr:peptidoglycan-binding protein [Vicinamibacteria bacterium]